MTEIDKAEKQYGETVCDWHQYLRYDSEIKECKK